jgi:hypothetical protein
VRAVGIQFGAQGDDFSILADRAAEIVGSGWDIAGGLPVIKALFRGYAFHGKLVKGAAESKTRAQVGGKASLREINGR